MLGSAGSGYARAYAARPGGERPDGHRGPASRSRGRPRGAAGRLAAALGAARRRGGRAGPGRRRSRRSACGRWPRPGRPLLVVALCRRSLRASFGIGLVFGVAFFVPLLSWLVNVAWYAWAALAIAEAVIFAVLAIGQRLLLRLPGLAGRGGVLVGGGRGDAGPLAVRVPVGTAGDEPGRRADRALGRHRRAAAAVPSWSRSPARRWPGRC